MEGLETIWDINDRGGQSTVQKLGNTCTKLYPISTNPIISRGHVTLDQLQAYHCFQSKLSGKTIKIQSYGDHQHEELWRLGYRKLHVSFLDLGQVNVNYGSDMHTKQKLLITQMPYIEGQAVINKSHGHAIKTLIARAYEEDRVSKSSISMQNLKIVSFENGEAYIICTDVFWNIPKYVNQLLTATD